MLQPEYKMFGDRAPLDAVHLEVLGWSPEYHRNRDSNDYSIAQKLKAVLNLKYSARNKHNAIQLFTGLANMTLDYASKGEVSLDSITSVLKVLAKSRFLPSQEFRSRASTAIARTMREQERKQYVPKLLSDLSLLGCDVSQDMLGILCSANFNSSSTTLEALISDVYASMQFCRVKQPGVGHERYGMVLLDQLVLKYAFSSLEIQTQYACKMRSVKAHSVFVYGVELDVKIPTIVEKPWVVSGSNKDIQNALTKIFGQCDAFVFMEEIQEWVDFVIPSEKMIFLLLNRQDYYWNKSTILPKTKLIADLLSKDCGKMVVTLDDEKIKSIMIEPLEDKRFKNLTGYIRNCTAQPLANGSFVARVQSSEPDEKLKR